VVWVGFFFFFNDTATTEIYTVLHTLSLHDALPFLPRAASLLEALNAERSTLARTSA